MATKTKSKTTSRNRPHDDRPAPLKPEALTAVHIDVLRTLEKQHRLSLGPATLGVICEVSGGKVRHISLAVHDLWRHGLVVADPSSIDSEQGRRYRLSETGRSALSKVRKTRGDSNASAPSPEPVSDNPPDDDSLTDVEFDALHALDRLCFQGTHRATAIEIARFAERSLGEIAPALRSLWARVMVAVQVDDKSPALYALTNSGRNTLAKAKLARVGIGTSAKTEAPPVRPSQSGSFEHLTVRVPMSRSRQTPHGLMHSFYCSHPECSQPLSPERLSAQDALNDAMDNGAVIVGNQIFHGRCMGRSEMAMQDALVMLGVEACKKIVMDRSNSLLDVDSKILEIDSAAKARAVLSASADKTARPKIMTQLERMGINVSDLMSMFERALRGIVNLDRPIPIAPRPASKRRAAKKAKR